MTNTSTVLITGGTGLVGQVLRQQLLAKGYAIKLLSSSKSKCNGIDVFYWNIENEHIDKKALENVDYIIHLAGANISEKKWSAQQKKIIIESRTLSTKILVNELKKNKQNLKAFISSSATGYYGAITSEQIFKETDKNANDFLGNVCAQWEEGVEEINTLGIRTVKLRTGVVLSKEGGALKKLIAPARWGLSAAMGSGKQYLPWIHIDDLCKMYIHCLENSNIEGVYNAVAPQHITNKKFTKELALHLNKPYFLPNIPYFLLKAVLGEMSLIILEGSRISNEKIIATGFQFQFNTIKEALESLKNKS